MIITEKKLDETDKKILRLCGEGLTVKEIASEIKISRHTVSVRIREMKKYYRCSNLSQLVLKCREKL